MEGFWVAPLMRAIYRNRRIILNAAVKYPRGPKYLTIWYLGFPYRES